MPTMIAPIEQLMILLLIAATDPASVIATGAGLVLPDRRHVGGDHADDRRRLWLLPARRALPHLGRPGDDDIITVAFGVVAFSVLVQGPVSYTHLTLPTSDLV